MNRFNTTTGKVVEYYTMFAYANQDWYPNPSFISSDIKSNVIWFGRDNFGITWLDIQSGSFILSPLQRPGNYQLGFSPLLEDNDGDIWTTNDNNEILYYDMKHNWWYFHKVDIKVATFYGESPFIYQGKGNRIWISTDNGLITIDKDEKPFYTCQYLASNPLSLSGNDITNIRRSKYGQFFAISGFVSVFDESTKTFSPLELPADIIDEHVIGIANSYEDKNGIIWFTGAIGIISYDPRTKASRKYQLHDDSGSLNRGGGYGSMVEDKNGNYWLATWNQGFCTFDPITGRARKFSVHKGPNSISTNHLESIFIDSRNIIYLGSEDGGFITFNPVTELFEIFHHNPDDPTSVSSEKPRSFIEDKNGLIWFSTLDAGINVFNPVTKKFISFTTKDGLPHNIVAGLIEDNNGNYWAATHHGISCFTPVDDPFIPGIRLQFRNYDVNDGLPTNLFRFNSTFRDPDGTLYFGTDGFGMLYFHPDSLKDNLIIPPVFITAFYLHNKLVHYRDSNSVLDAPIEFTKEISLNYRQNLISFEFAGLNYSHSEKNKYAHMLEGYDEDWIYTDARKRFVTYTNLDPGDYIFKVKASNNDGIWNDTPKVIRLMIAPPFWQTLWFKFITIIILSGIVYFFYRYRLSQVLTLQSIRNKIASDLHDDIGSTLNSISVYSEVAKKDPDRRDHALSMIGESSRKIIDSMSDIVWTINPDNDSFDRIVSRMRSISYNLLKARKIDFAFKADESLNKILLPMETRRNFYLIFKEAINNLVKYSEATRASITLSQESNIVILTVLDDGIGFDSSQAYNGNGLNNMKRRAIDMQATLNIDSSIGMGTRIELQMKI